MWEVSRHKALKRVTTYANAALESQTIDTMPNFNKPLRVFFNINLCSIVFANGNKVVSCSTIASDFTPVQRDTAYNTTESVPG